MGTVSQIATAYSRRSRARRDDVFRQLFVISKDTKLLDLGSESGEHVAALVAKTEITPSNVYIADIDFNAVAEGAHRFGFTPIVIDESGSLPFPDGFFDIVHCSSVLEHVTVPKNDVWRIRSGRQFKKLATESQKRFASEIMRVGRQYYVQTPHKWFPIESHSWLPFIGWLPRRFLVPVLRFTNTFWVKKTTPDWRLLDASQLAALFEGRPVIEEKSLGLVKSVTAARHDSPNKV